MSFFAAYANFVAFSIFLLILSLEKFTTRFIEFFKFAYSYKLNTILKDI